VNGCEAEVQAGPAAAGVRFVSKRGGNRGACPFSAQRGQRTASARADTRQLVIRQFREKNTREGIKRWYTGLDVAVQILLRLYPWAEHRFLPRIARVIREGVCHFL
jgi:hypothetical protein